MDWLPVCNLALSRIGQDPQITGINPPDGSVEAQLCAQFLPVVLAKAFSAKDWSFLTIKDKLAEVAHEKPHPPYAFIYMYPADAEKINYVFDPDFGDYPNQFSVEAGRDGAQFICTNAREAWCEYQMLPENVAYFPAWFTDAVAWSLAAELAGAIVKGSTGAQLAANCIQMYEMSILRAGDRDAVQRREYLANFRSEFEKARLL